MTKYEVYDMIEKVGPFYTVWCGVGIRCCDCEFNKQYRGLNNLDRCPYNLISMELFGRTYMVNWNEVQKLVQSLVKEE